MSNTQNIEPVLADDVASALYNVCKRIELECKVSSNSAPDQGAVIDQWCHAALSLAIACTVFDGKVAVPEELKKRLLSMLEPNNG